MKKRKLLALLLAVSTTVSLAACGGGGSTDTSADTAADTQNTANTAANEEIPADEEVAGEEDAGDEGAVSDGNTLSVMIWDTYQEPGINELLSDFTAETGIKTELQVVKWDEYWTLLSAGAEGGSLPDVFWMHSNESERYMSNDMLLDLNDRIEASELIDPANYPEDIWGLYTYDDHKYAVPKDIDTIAIWYNKKLFDEAGVDYPTSDWTWDDLYETAKKLTKEDGSVYGYANSSSNNQAGYYNMIYAMGGEVISEDKKSSGYDKPETIEAMKFMDKFIQEGLMPTQDVMSETTEEVLFMSGKVAMVPQGSWMLAAMMENEYTTENADVVELPKDAETGRSPSIYNGLGWTAAANTQYPEEAWKLIEFLGSETAQKKQAELGITMSAYEGTSDAWINSATQFNLQAYLNMQEDMVIRPYSKNTVVWENLTKDCFTKAWTGEVTMEEACQNAAEEMNSILAEE